MIKVLVVEDFPLLREDICEMLSSQGDMVAAGTASTGAEAVELAKGGGFDVILMDIEMETVNAGILAAERIRDLLPDQKIIFLTAHETDQMVITAMGTGAVDYLVKGGDEGQIPDHVRNAYLGRPVLDAKIQETVMKEYKRLQCSERSLLFFINNISLLTQTERELVRLLLEGHKVKEIARIRSVEVITVKTQIKGLLRKFGCSRTKEVVAMIEGLNIRHLF